MTQSESLVSHAASESIRHFLKKWKYPNAPFNVNISYIKFCLVCVFSDPT